MAIFEFSSSNGFSLFNINFECRYIEIIAMEDETNTHFSYLVDLPFFDRWNFTTACNERGYEVCDNEECNRYWGNCITTFQGQKCSMEKLSGSALPMQHWESNARN